MCLRFALFVTYACILSQCQGESSGAVPAHLLSFSGFYVALPSNKQTNELKLGHKRITRAVR